MLSCVCRHNGGCTLVAYTYFGCCGNRMVEVATFVHVTVETHHLFSLLLARND